MKHLADIIDRFNHGIARAVRWLILFMVLIQFSIVVGRYVFGLNSIAMQESVLYLHSTLFMLAAGYTLLVDKHVRVDVFYATVSESTRRRIDIFGHVFFLIPMMVALIFWSWPSVKNSWAIFEGPISVGGLKAVFLLKTLIPIFCLLLLLQSISILIRLIGQSDKP